jgi:hypothetical protein
MAWPQVIDYAEAVQNLAAKFLDPELCAGRLAMNALGLPLTRSGSFAAVFEVHGSSGPDKWAVKCFTKNVPGLQQRYHEIDAHLRQRPLPFMVRFRYLPESVLVQGSWYPVLKMDWVEKGVTVRRWIGFRTS